MSGELDCGGMQPTSNPPPLARSATITALHIYPVKSCAGISLSRAQLTATGFTHDREWMIVHPNGRFVTQREEPRLALIRTTLENRALVLDAPERPPLRIDLGHAGESVEATVWNDRCRAIDAGATAAQWLEDFLGQRFRLVRFDPSWQRRANSKWTGALEAFNQFSDGFPWLLISEASLAALNQRLERPLPMNRFRPSIVVSDLEAFEEDRIAELSNSAVSLHPVKPCTRCAITTTDQQTGLRDGEEPLRTLRSFRLDRELKGVTFGQNVIVSKGINEWLEVGQRLQIRHRD